MQVDDIIGTLAFDFSQFDKHHGPTHAPFIKYD